MKTIILSGLFIAITFVLYAQPEPCGPSAEMTPTCQEACIICDIDGFTGVNGGTEQGVAPDGFCTTVWHNIQWIAFMAGSTDITLQVDVFNCTLTGWGLEIGIYESLDCENTLLVSNCDTNVSNNSSGTFSNTVPLTVGQYYYFVMDGSGGDICDYTVSVIEGNTEVDPLDATGAIFGKLDLCPGLTMPYSTEEIPGATIYDWTVNNTSVAEGLNVNIEWETPGTYQLCVTASNACDVATPTCQTVTVTPIPTTIINTIVCDDGCLEIADTSLCDPGNYQIILPSFLGCDSIFDIALEIFPDSEVGLDLNICDGDTLFVGNTPYFETGVYQELLSTYLGCDSTVTLDLNLIICEIEATYSMTPTVCAGESSGTLAFSVENGTAPFTYNWERIGQPTPSGSGSINALNVMETLTQLPQGEYIITILDNFGNDVVLLAIVTEPTPIIWSAVFSDFGGYNISCNGGSNGTIEVTATGGTPSYTYAWSNGDTGPNISGLSAGNYEMTLTDNAGCARTDVFNLNEPNEIILSADFENPDCDGPFSGSVTVNAVTGGTAPYQYALSGGVYGNETVFDSLGQGMYELMVLDSNGCMITETGTLSAPQIPELELGDDMTIDLGTSDVLTVSYNSVPLDTFFWSGEAGLSCYTCFMPTAMPYVTTTYTLTLISEDDCAASDSITVFVDPKRDVYIPNIFSPNYDGANDYFTIHAGLAVSNIRSFQIFSRWGELLFQQENFPANDIQYGWDGTFKNKAMPSSVYVWMVEVEFLDGFRQNYQGDVTLVR